MKLRVAIICILAYFAALRLDIDGELDFIHEGDRLAHIDALRAGAMPFRDIYVQQGLGENILKPLLACAWFGTDVAALRKLGSNAYLYRGILPPLGLVAAIIGVASLTRRWQVCAVAAGLFLLCWVEVTDRHVFGLLAIAAAGGYLHSRKGQWLFVAGVLTSLAALYSLDVGLFTLMAIGLWCAADTWITPFTGSRPREIVRRLTPFAGGAIIAFLPFLLWCAWHGIVGDFGLNVYWQVFLRGEARPGTYPRPWLNPDPQGQSNLYDGLKFFLLYYSIPLGSIGIAVAALKKRTSPPAIRSALTLAASLSVAFWFSVVGRPDEWHVAYAAGPFLLIVTLVLLPNSSWTQSNLRWSDLRCGPSTLGFLIWPGMITLLAMGQFGAAARWYNGSENPRVPERMRQRVAGAAAAECENPRVGRLLMTRPEARFIDEVCAYIQANSRADETILDLSNCGLFYFLAERRSSTRFHLLAHVGASPRLRSIMLDDVLKAPALPALAMTRVSDASTPDRLGEWLRANYQPTGKIAYMQFWKRK